MSKKKKVRGQRKNSQPVAETRPAEATTVAWMLVTLTTLLCEIGIVIATGVLYLRPGLEMMLVLANLLLFAAVVLGILGLLLAAGVLRLHKAAPPLPVTLFAILVCAAPIVMVAVRWVVA